MKIVLANGTLDILTLRFWQKNPPDNLGRDIDNKRKNDNCYNYGKVENGSSNHCGAIVGWMRRHNASRFTDNYYLDSSAARPFGSGSDGTSARADAKTASEFASGEVCNLVNGSSSASNVIWRQDVYNGNTPYDIYPLYDADIVYRHGDNTYSNSPEEFSVTISWGAMDFEYDEGRWDPDTHKYSGGWAPMTDDGNTLNVQNNSNVAVGVGFEFVSDTAFTKYNLTGTFNGVSTETNRLEGNASLDTELDLRSLKPENLKNSATQKLGEITVRLTTIGGGGN